MMRLASWMSTYQSAEVLSTAELLRYLALELNAVGAVSGHRFTSECPIACQSSHWKLPASRGTLQEVNKQASPLTI